jgi:hypothetical protein
MEDHEILDAIYENFGAWADEQIGEFVRRALIEDITQEDLEKDMGLNRVRE